jgi:hypothetical protein
MAAWASTELAGLSANLEVARILEDLAAAGTLQGTSLGNFGEIAPGKEATTEGSRTEVTSQTDL